jgi:hypothetical protein
MNGRKVFKFDIKLSSATISEEWGYNNYQRHFQQYLTYIVAVSFIVESGVKHQQTYKHLLIHDFHIT